MSLTLALDELLTNPKHTRALAALQAMVPGYFTDQADAAARDSEGLANAFSHVSGAGPNVYAEAAAFPDWLRLGVLDVLAGWFTGKADTCRHNPHPGSPQPIVAAAWKPGLISCLACMHLLACRPGSLGRPDLRRLRA